MIWFALLIIKINKNSCQLMFSCIKEREIRIVHSHKIDGMLQSATGYCGCCLPEDPPERGISVVAPCGSGKSHLCSHDARFTDQDGFLPPRLVKADRTTAVLVEIDLLTDCELAKGHHVVGSSFYDPLMVDAYVLPDGDLLEKYNLEKEDSFPPEFMQHQKDVFVPLCKQFAREHGTKILESWEHLNAFLCGKVAAINNNEFHHPLRGAQKAEVSAEAQSH